MSVYNRSNLYTNLTQFGKSGFSKIFLVLFYFLKNVALLSRKRPKP